MSKITYKINIYKASTLDYVKYFNYGFRDINLFGVF